MPLLPRNKNLLGYARLLRREMTPQERRLWYEFLRDFPMKFYRQRVVGNFIVDFYCAFFKLAIEVDGGQHCDEAVVKYDLERTKFLKSLGITVLRYTNLDVAENFEAVCVDIENFVSERAFRPPV